jgi:hypothetical protein
VLGNTAQTVTWAVSGTTAAPYDVANVRILYSTDGGLTFPTELAAATANDGSEPVTVPDVATSQGRFKVEAVGNVFFDVSDGNLTVTPATGTVTTTPTETATETATEVPTETASSTATSSATATETSSPISAATSSPIASETTTAFPTVIPSSTTFVPLLTGGSRRPRATSTGRIRVRIGCAPKVPGAAVPPACIGRVKLRAVIDGRSRRIASRVFVRPGGTARRVRITLSRRARNALPLTARVIATAGLDRATKRISIRAPR